MGWPSLSGGTLRCAVGVRKKGPVTCTPTDLRGHPGAKTHVDALKDPAERRDLPDAALVRGEAEARPRHILFLEHVVVPPEAFLSLAVRQLGRSGPQLRGLHEQTGPRRRGRSTLLGNFLQPTRQAAPGHLGITTMMMLVDNVEGDACGARVFFSWTALV